MFSILSSFLICFNCCLAQGGRLDWKSPHSLQELITAPVSLIPYPKEVSFYSGRLNITKITISEKSNLQGLEFIMDALKRICNEYNINLDSSDDDRQLKLHLLIDSSLSTHEEGYKLEVSKQNVSIVASKAAGLYNGLQTLRQLVVVMAKLPSLPLCKISDWPAFQVRGFMHDTGRNFQTLESLKIQLELLSRYKYNTFHWHLTDNPAWRIESKLFPKLNDAQYRNPQRDPDSTYSFDDIRELIRFARQRNITIIPELDMPGHSAYFEKVFGFKMETEKGMQVLEQLIDEFCTEISTDDCPIIHIGSDEVHIPNPAGFIRRMTNKVIANGRKVMVWKPGLTALPGTIQQIWREEASPASFVTVQDPYIDSYAGYLNSGDAVTLIRRYFFQQVCNRFTGNSTALGGILCCWPDTRVDDKSKIFRHNPVWPGVLTYSEAVWCGRPQGNSEYIKIFPPKNTMAEKYYREFESRLANHRDKFFKGVDFPFLAASNIEWELAQVYRAAQQPVSMPTLRTTLAGAVIHIDSTSMSGFQINDVTCVELISYIFSETRKEISALIGFETPARSNRQSAGLPLNGSWDANGGKVYINEKELQGPVWDNPGGNRFLKPTWHTEANEIPYEDEEFFWSRKPVKIQLRQGWNKLRVIVPKSYPAQAWMFAFVPVRSDITGKWIRDDTVIIQARRNEKKKSSNN